MNYLALANKMCRAIGYAEMPSIALAGVDQQLVLEWIADAWVYIQELEDRWSFMKFSGTVNATAGKDTYTPVEIGLPNLKEILAERVILKDMSGDFISYVHWISPEEMEYKHTASPKTGVIEYFTEEGGEFKVYPTPDTQYQADIKYMINPVVLENDTDIPACPEHFHKIILFKALHEYAISDNSPEQFQFGSAEFEQYLNRLNAQCAPQVSLTGRKTGAFYDRKHSGTYSKSW